MSRRDIPEGVGSDSSPEALVPGQASGGGVFPGIGGSPCSEPTEAADEKGPGIVIRGSRRVQCQKVRVSPSSGMITLPHTPRSVRRFFMSGREIVAWATASM